MYDADTLWYEELEKNTEKTDGTGRSRRYASEFDEFYDDTDRYLENTFRKSNRRSTDRRKKKQSTCTSKDYSRRNSKETKRKRKARRKIRLRFLSIAIVFVVLFFCITQGSAIARNIILRSSGCPESLIELAERQPEAYDFAKNYRKYAGQDISIDISDEVRAGKIPLFIQWDKRWGYRDYGGNYMALNGCGPTCLSMVYCGLTGDTDWNPWKMAQWADDNGYYVPGSGTAWSLMSEGAGKLGLQVMEATPDTDTVTEELAKGKVIIACMGPGDFTTQGHFIVLTKVTGSGKVVVNDPNSKKRSKETWDVERLVSQMKDMWVYQ